MRVAGHHVTFLNTALKQNALSSPALVRGNHVPEATNVFDNLLKLPVAQRTSVRFIAFHYDSPLVSTHCTSPRIC